MDQSVLLVMQLPPSMQSGLNDSNDYDFEGERQPVALSCRLPHGKKERCVLSPSASRTTAIRQNVHEQTLSAQLKEAIRHNPQPLKSTWIVGLLLPFPLVIRTHLDGPFLGVTFPDAACENSLVV